MKTSAFLLFSVSLFFSFSASGQEHKTIPSKLTEAVVFFQGAELVHTAGTHLAKGENTVSIEGLSPQIDLNSLKVKTTNSVVVAAHEFSIDYLSSAKASTPAIRKLRDSADFYKTELEKIGIAKRINLKMIDFLQSGTEKNVSGSEQGLGIDDLIKTMDYYKAKARELQTEQTALEKQEQELKKSADRIQAQLRQESLKGGKTSGILKLTLSAPMAGNTEFTVSYFTQAASWTPYYDVHIASTDRPIVFSAKSKVRQTTGLDWEKVRLSLSTATPSSGKTAPLFNAWFLRPVVPALNIRSDSRNAMMQNSYSYDEEVVAESLQGQAPGIRIRGAGSANASAPPLYVVDGVAMEDISHIDPEMIKSISVLKDPSALSVYGSRASNGVVLVDLKNEMEDFVSAAENELNISYNIDLPYTIPGNGKAQTIDLQSREASAEYKYYCAPKLDTETYLLAEISDWQNLGLLSGTANVTYDGTYIGETYIDASSTQPRLTLTLGTDKRVAVKRELLRDFSTSRTLGSDTQQVFTYQITVKNNQNKAVKMVLKDQYPISTDKSITVELRKETTNWTANLEDTGVITWEETLAPGETKIYRISYSVRYPKGKKLNL